MKKTYIKPSLNKFIFDANDIISLSSNTKLQTDKYKKCDGINVIEF